METLLYSRDIPIMRIN